MTPQDGILAQCLDRCEKAFYDLGLAIRDAQELLDEAPTTEQQERISR